MEWLLKRGRGLLPYCLVGYILEGVQPAVRLGLRLTDGSESSKEDAASVVSLVSPPHPKSFPSFTTG